MYKAEIIIDTVNAGILKLQVKVIVWVVCAGEIVIMANPSSGVGKIIDALFVSFVSYFDTS